VKEAVRIALWAEKVVPSISAGFRDGTLLRHTTLECRTASSNKEYNVSVHRVQHESSSAIVTIARYGPIATPTQQQDFKYSGPDEAAAIVAFERTVASKLKPHGGTQYTELLPPMFRDPHILVGAMKTLVAVLEAGGNHAQVGYAKEFWRHLTQRTHFAWSQDWNDILHGQPLPTLPAELWPLIATIGSEQHAAQLHACCQAQKLTEVRSEVRSRPTHRSRRPGL
jgi:hypothetical protein